MSLPFQRVDDFIEAHEITDQRQMLAVSCLIRVSECAGHDVAEFGDVAHVNATYVRINGKSPARVCREGFGPGHNRKQGEQQDFVQRINDLATLPWIRQISK